MTGPRRLEASWDPRNGLTIEGIEADVDERVELRSTDDVARWLEVTRDEAARVTSALHEELAPPAPQPETASPAIPEQVEAPEHDDASLQDVRWAEYMAEEVTSDAAMTESVEDDAQAATDRVIASDARASVGRGRSPVSVRATSAEAHAAGSMAQNEADERQGLELAAGNPSTRRHLAAISRVEARAKAQTEDRRVAEPGWFDRYDYAPRHQVAGIQQEAR